MREFVLLGLAPPYVLELTNDDCKQTLFHDVIQALVKKNCLCVILFLLASRLAGGG